MSEVRQPQQAATPDPAVATMRAALDAANARLAERTRERDEARTQLHGVSVRAATAEDTAVSNAIAAAENEASTLADRHAALLQEGNFAEASKLGLKIAEVGARIDRFKAQKDWLAQNRTAAPQPQAQQDPMARFNDRERSWITLNPDYLTDPLVEARVNDAALKAIHRDGLVKDSPEYFQALDRAAHPERHAAANGGAAPQSQTAATGNPDGGNDAPFSGADDTGVDPQLPQITVQQEHTMPAAPIQIAVDPRDSMQINANPDQGGEPAQRQRAVGKGGEGMRSVAAPPSRNINRAASRAAGARGVINPTPEEVSTAVTLAETIEPELAMRGDRDEIVRWYYALAHSPTHLSARRRTWARDSIVG